MRPSLLLLVLAVLAPACAAAQADPHAGHLMPAPAADPHAGHLMAGMDAAAHAMPAAGVLGPYPMTREASGTAWQPDASRHDGVHATAGPWSLMGHATVNLVHSAQGGPRGDEKTFLAGMVMGAARRDFAGGHVLNLRAMLSPDPLMGRRGYPLLLAAGETADGAAPLVDRQHPHDLFMELSAAYSRRIGRRDSLFVYAGLPGEPAFGPPAFMHRLSTADSPEAPISHHWLDSTHITFGVVTAGWTHGAWKLEASRFKGREPDERRYDIEAPRLDSTSARLSWNPGSRWSLQGSWAELESPEALEPALDERRWSASAIYTAPLGRAGLWSATAAWGRKVRSDGVAADALALEVALKPNAAWTLFARAEQVETDELDAHAGHVHGGLETAAKLSLGGVRDWRVAPHARFGLGGLYTFNRIPAGLRHAYGRSPDGAMIFTRLVID
jgi:hypothetical protein